MQNLEIITLSRYSERNVKTIEGTFKYDGELIPMRVNEDDRPNEFREIEKLLNQPNLDFAEVSQELFSLMSPEAKVRSSIKSSYYLSESLSIRDGFIFFGENKLEETLASHMMSLLNEQNIPKDDSVWRSYVKFLDNLYQNADEDIRNQLFRWIEYENKAGHAFGITDDGCIVGYKGCAGSVLEPMSVFSGNAIVDGVEYDGKIPNRVGSVIQMPRSAVTADPAVGCSYGLHVGTRDYAVKWAPVLILVKVNPRDIVSVPYECESQKMRVCEYTVLKVTDALDEHKMYHTSNENEDLSSGFIYDLLGEEVSIEYDGGLSEEGIVVDAYENDSSYVVILETYDGDIVNICASKIDSWEILSCEDCDCDGVCEKYRDCEDDIEETCCESSEMNVSEAVELLSENSNIYILRDDDNEYKGKVVDVYVAVGKDPGVIVRNENGDYSHIKLHKIKYWEEVQEDDEPEEENEENLNLEIYKAIYELTQGTLIVVVHKDFFSGVRTSIGKVLSTNKNDMTLSIVDENRRLIVIDFTNVLKLSF